MLCMTQLSYIGAVNRHDNGIFFEGHPIISNDSLISQEVYLKSELCFSS